MQPQPAETKEHICRDDGYTPYVRPCQACLTQLSRNSVELHRRRSVRAKVVQS